MVMLIIHTECIRSKAPKCGMNPKCATAHGSTPTTCALVFAISVCELCASVF